MGHPLSVLSQITQHVSQKVTVSLPPVKLETFQKSTNITDTHKHTHTNQPETKHPKHILVRRRRVVVVVIVVVLSSDLNKLIKKQ